jgi:hypothetical protein
VTCTRAGAGTAGDAGVAPTRHDDGPVSGAADRRDMAINDASIAFGRQRQ